jgi:hypothetical protein
MPEKYIPPIKNPPFFVSVISGGIRITMKYAFLSDYAYHVIKRQDIGILQEYYQLSDITLDDTTVVNGVTYTYQLVVMGMNGISYTTEQTIAYTIT